MLPNEEDGGAGGGEADWSYDFDTADWSYDFGVDDSPARNDEPCSRLNMSARSIR